MKNKNEMIQVRHSKKTSGENAPDGDTWINYWKIKTKRGIPKVCPSCGGNPTEDNYMVGAHVEKFIELSSQQKTKYITPTCNICNSKYKGINLYNSFWVNKSDLLELDE